MKQLFFFIASFFMYTAVSAQCTIDGSNLPAPGVYPTAANLPHIQQGVFYDETVQGRIQSSGDTSVLGFTINIRVDSVRIDSITGRPAGINWAKNPNTLPGGGTGCVRFSGTTNASAGTYPLTAWGTAYLYLSNTPAGAADGPRAITGNLNQYSPFGGYYLTVDAGTTLSVSASKTDVNCFGGNTGTATVTPTGGSNYTYAWSNNGNTASISGLTAGTYTVTVTSNGSTTATASVTITQPTQVTASGSATPSTGSNGTATVTPGGGTPGYTYVWNNNQTTATINGLAPATYTVTVTDSKGCTATASATVNNGSNTLSVNVTQTDVTCFGLNNGSATANASGSSNYTYNWSNNATTATVSNLSPGTYTVTVSANGSSVTASVIITQPAALTATTNSTASSGSNGVAIVTATGGTPPYTYSWSNNSTNDTITGLAQGNYTVTVSDSRSCTVTSIATVVVLTGINNIDANYALSVYPNPANDVVNVTAEIPSGDVNVRVLNLAGQVVYTAHQYSSGSYKAAINCADFTAGVYVLELNAANQIARKRFVIAK